MKKINTLFCALTLFSGAVFQNANAQNIYNFAGTSGSMGFSGDAGPATASQITSPNGLGADGAGNVYISDDYRLRKVSTSGVITTIAGYGVRGFSGDGGPALSALIDAGSLAVDAIGNIFIAQPFRVRKIDTAGIINTIVGTGVVGFSGDGGPASTAKFNIINAITVDGSGNIYVSDRLNYRVRKINTSGIVTTIAGVGSSSFLGDGGPATDAQLSCQGLLVDGSGNLFIADDLNNRIRKVSAATGIITTVVGNGTAGFGGDGGAATAAMLSGPYDVKATASGNLYISDLNNFRVRKVNSSGIITTIAGNGTMACTGNGGAATAASIFSPGSLTFNGLGNLLIADVECPQVRRITISAVGVDDVSVAKESVLAVFPNPSNGRVTIRLESANDEKVAVTITDVVGAVICRQSITTNHATEMQLMLAPGIYLVSANTGDGKAVQRIVVQ